jgi:hypothetical protein
MSTNRKSFFSLKNLKLRNFANFPKNTGTVWSLFYFFKENADRLFLFHL